MTHQWMIKRAPAPRSASGPWTYTPAILLAVVAACTAADIERAPKTPEDDGGVSGMAKRDGRSPDLTAEPSRPPEDAAPPGSGARDSGGLDAVRDAGPVSDAARDRIAADGPTGSPRVARVYYAYQGSIGLLTLDKTMGLLSVVKSYPAGGRSDYLALAPSGAFAYVSDPVVKDPKTEVGRISTFAIDSASGVPTKIQSTETGGVAPYHVAVHPSGRWAFVANHTTGTVSLFPVAMDGKLGTPQTVSPGAKPAQIVFDPSGRFAYVPCMGANHVAQYRFDAGTGALTPNDPPRVSLDVEGAGPRHLAFHPDGRWSYLVNEPKGLVTLFTFNPQSGTLSEPMSVPSTTTPGKVHGGSHIVVHPNGKFLYITDRVLDFVAAFAIDAATGKPSVIQRDDFGGTIVQPRDFDMDREGNHLVVASKHVHKSIVLRIDANTGMLTPAGEPVATCCLPQSVVIAD